MADLHILCRMCTVEGVAAPSGRCLRSGHKNSIKGKGAIKHEGAPTIIYHCTDAPFRLAPLATHPLSGGGQEKDGFPLPSRSARHPPPKWGWARKMEAPFRLAPLATHPPSGGGRENMESPFRLAPLATHPQVGVGKKKMEAPFRLAALATHPLSGGGQEKHGGKEELTQTLVSPAEL